MVSLIGSAVAEIRTGARNRKEKGFCRPPVKKQKSSQFDDVQGQQRRRVGRLQPLHRVESDLQDEIEQGGQADDGHTGGDLDIEFEPLDHDEDGDELAEHGEPTQPQYRVQTDIAARMTKIGGGDVSHSLSLAAPCPDHKFASSVLSSLRHSRA